MRSEQQILLDHVTTHLENACKVILLGDEPLTRRAEVASVEVELLHADDLEAVPESLQSDIRDLTRLATEGFTQDIAVKYASRLLDVYVRAENVR